MPRTYPNLKAYFRAEGRTQGDLAHELGISPALMSMYKHGDRQPPLALALRISERCRIPPESLIRVQRPTPAKADHRPGRKANLPSLHNTNRRSAGASGPAANESSQSGNNGKTSTFTRSKH